MYNTRKYDDIFAPRKNDNNLLWVSRTLRPQVAYRQPTRPLPQDHKDQVLTSPKILEFLLEMSEKQKLSVEELKSRVSEILDEIGYDKKLQLIRLLGLVIIKMFGRVGVGIYVNRDAVLQMRARMGACPVIFVPSHRSYADFILMSYMCFTMEVAIPAIAAGMDFHGMWGMGTMLRDTGAFFMRRSYNDDNLYWTTFKQYVYQIVTKGELPLEFFIEGTRSRANKSLMPKFGFVNMVLKALFLGQVPDILFVPINISYERILEEKLFAFELLGIPKPKESTKGFFKSLSILGEKFGSVHFDFSEAISGREFFGRDLYSSNHNFGPIHQQEMTEKEKSLVPSLAHEIIRRQQKHCVISVFNLVAMVLQDSYAQGGKNMEFGELVENVEGVKQVLELFGGYVHVGNVTIEEKCRESLEIHKNFVGLDQNGRVTLIWDKIVLDKFNPSRLKAHRLSEGTISRAVPFVMLQIYVNPTLHYLIDAAIIVVVLKQGAMSKGALFEAYTFLREMFAHEFVYFKPKGHEEFENGLNNGLKLDLLSCFDGFYALGPNGKLQTMLMGLLDCFLYSYSVVIHTLSGSPAVLDEKSILTQVQATIEQSINGTDFVNPYALSLDTLVNCLNVLSEQKILRKTRDKAAVFYEIDNAKIGGIKEKLGQYVQLSSSGSDIRLQLQNKL